MTITEEKKATFDEKKYADTQSQIDKIHDKWKSTSYLEGVPDDRSRQLAVILDNQHLFLQSLDYNSPFCKVALEITSKVFRDFIGFELVPVQPLLGPVGNVYYKELKISEEDGKVKSDLEMCSREIKSISRWLQFHVSYQDYESEGFVDRTAKEVREKITREVVTDLRNNAGTVAVKSIREPDLEQIYVNLTEMSGVIHRKTMRGGVKWLFTSPEIAKTLMPSLSSEISELTSIKKVGTFSSAWKVFVDPLFPKNQILCGGYEEDLAGYVYSPYVFLSESGVILDPESFMPRTRWITRYGKCLLSAKPYGRINYTVEEKDNGSYSI